MGFIRDIEDPKRLRVYFDKEAFGGDIKEIERGRHVEYELKRQAKLNQQAIKIKGPMAKKVVVL